MQMPPVRPIVFPLGTARTFELNGTGLDNVEDVNVTTSNPSVTWSASIGDGQSATSLKVLATPTLVNGGEVPSGEVQVLISPVGSGYTLGDTFTLDDSPPIHCTVTSDGSTVYTAGEQLSMVAQFSA